MQILIIKEFVDRLKYNLLITNPVQMLLQSYSFIFLLF